MLVAVVAVLAAASQDRGFNARIAWSNELSTSLARASSEGKPAMVLIHKTWCGACKRLKSVFEHAEIEELSKQLVMVNLEDDEEPTDPMYKPDGGYVPRMFFVDASSGKLLPIHNELGNPQYKYYYASEDQIIAAMKKAVAK